LNAAAPRTAAAFNSTGPSSASRANWAWRKTPRSEGTTPGVRFPVTRRTLAKHYGFTPEELDFILNYDIKYRLGQDEADED
jgi:hypothetical protein